MSEKIETWKVLCYTVNDYREKAAKELDAIIAAAEERGRRSGLEEAAKCVRRMAGRDWDGEYEEPLLDAVKQIRELAPRDPGKVEP